MASFRNLALKILNKTAGIFPPKFLAALSNQKLILPFYHTISDDNMPHIKHLYPVKRVKDFIRDLDFLLKIYEPIDYKKLIDLTLNKKKPEKPSFLLTFDDGLREFYDVIAPLLIQKGIPAVCFLNSSFIDNKNLFYRYKSSLLIDKFMEDPELIKRKEVGVWLLSLFSNSKSVLESLLSITYQNKNYIDELAKLIHYDFNNFLTDHKPYLTGEQIFSLIKQGFHFGAHSVDHPEYQYLELNEQIRQTKESMEYICHRFSPDYKAFSFPFTDFGVSQKFFTYLHENNISDASFGSAGQKKDTAFNNLQRIPFEKDNLSARKIHNFELLYYILKIPFNKNVIIRND